MSDFPTQPADGGEAPGDELRRALRRCPPATYEAAVAYRRTRRTSLLPQIAIGILVRYAAPALRHRLATPEPGLRLAEDLGLDSLDRLQAVMLLEEVLQVRVDDGLLPDLRTLGDVLRIVTSVARGNEMEPAAG